MATLSHEAFRRMIEKFGGCDEYFTEMINAGSLLTRGPFEKYYLMNGTAPEKIVWQLTGSKAPFMAEAALVVASLGGAGVDLNMGCSAPEIIASGAGLSWMLKPVEESQLMVRSVKRALEQNEKESGKKTRLSVKLRLGDENYTDEGFFSFCDMLVGEGVELLTLHPRTRRQKYSRPAHWEYVQRLAECVRQKGVAVFLNGDVKDAASALAALKAAPDADGIMIARSAAQKPWIFAEIAAAFAGNNLPGGYSLKTTGASAVQKIDIYELVLDYLKDLQLYQPEEFWKTRMQRFFTYFCNNFSFAHYCQTQMLNSKNIEEAESRLLSYFEKVPEDRFISVPVCANQASLEK